MSPASRPMSVHARARPIHGRGKLVVPKTGVRVGFARARVPIAPAPRVEAAEAARSRDFRDLCVLVSGGGRRWYTKISPLALAGHTFHDCAQKSQVARDFCKRAPCAITDPFENARAKQHSRCCTPPYHHVPVGSFACVCRTSTFFVGDHVHHDQRTFSPRRQQYRCPCSS